MGHPRPDATYWTQSNTEALDENVWSVYFWHEPEFVSVWIFEHSVLHFLVPFGFSKFSGELDAFPFQLLIGSFDIVRVE